jgi:ATP-binding cassette subfamily G (WHITE) protein 2 (SNQ2)
MEPPNSQKPRKDDTPGSWPETPAESTRTASTAGTTDRLTPVPIVNDSGAPEISSPETPRATKLSTFMGVATEDTAAKETQVDRSGASTPRAYDGEKDEIHHQSTEKSTMMEPIKTGRQGSADMSDLVKKQSTRREMNQEDLFRALSKKRTNASLGSQGTAETDEENAEVERLMSRMFGKTRQANSEEEKTRHVGLVFKNLTVKGMGLGAALQPTVGDMFLGLPRLISGLFSKGKKIGGKPPVRTILNDFNGCVKPGEMLLVLGKPGSGCSTFLKVLGNQRFGYESVEGSVTYGGSDAAEMQKNFRGEVLYNPEDDLHYATLKVKETLTFALTTRTPGKDSRAEGETRDQYVKEFLRVISKLFWIEHTMGTKVGNEFIRGVSGGEKKRYVSPLIRVFDTNAKQCEYCGSHDHKSLDTMLGQQHSRTRCQHCSRIRPKFEVAHQYGPCQHLRCFIPGGRNPLRSLRQSCGPR